MPKPGGMQADTIGPLMFSKGVDGRPIPEMGPEGCENLWNLDMDHAGRHVPRPGSVFQSRIGRGPILGMAEHTFESGAKRPRQVAMVADAFPYAYALVNPAPHTVNGEAVPGEPGVASHVGFCPDWSLHGQPVLPVTARQSDRFVFASLLNRVYMAGSTLDSRIRWFDYEVQLFDEIPGVRGRAVVAVGNRLFVAGDPARPNVIYPSNPDEPEEFELQLGMQIGTRNDEILRMVEHQGMILVLSTRSCHWLFPGAIELGDIETETISRVHGIAGRLAADEAADGWVYWLSPSEGPVRWRRGQQSVDTTFAADMLPIWKAVLKGRNRSAVVFDDPGAGAVRFLVASGDCPVPNYLFSYFYRSGDGWTHGASTDDLENARKVRDVGGKLHTKLGKDWYTAAYATQDQLLGGQRAFSGDFEGHIWYWTQGVKDRIRGYAGETHQSFRCMLRPGPLEIAPIGHRATIHRSILDALIGFNWKANVLSELDYRDEWREVMTAEHSTAGGFADSLILDDPQEGRALDRWHHPAHLRLPLWEDGLAKIVRLEFNFDPLLPLVPLGIEFERSLSTEAQEPYLHPPTAFGRTEPWCAEEEEEVVAAPDWSGFMIFTDVHNSTSPDDDGHQVAGPLELVCFTWCNEQVCGGPGGFLIWYSNDPDHIAQGCSHPDNPIPGLIAGSS